MTRWYFYPDLYDRERFVQLLCEGYSVREICDLLGCSRAAVYSALRNHGIKRPFVVDRKREGELL